MLQKSCKLSQHASVDATHSHYLLGYAVNKTVKRHWPSRSVGPGSFAIQMLPGATPHSIPVLIRAHVRQRDIVMYCCIAGRLFRCFVRRGAGNPQMTWFTSGIVQYFSAILYRFTTRDEICLCFIFIIYLIVV